MDASAKHPVMLEQSAMAVVICKGKILCTRERIYGKTVLSLPKGHIEAGETAVQAAVRECSEETGVQLDERDSVSALEEFTVRFRDYRGRRIRKTIYPILFRPAAEGTTHIRERAIVSAQYMKVDDFIRDCSYDNVREIVRALKKERDA